MENNDTAVARERQAAELASLLPPVDVVEDATGITLFADLPGVPKDRLSVEVNGDTLTIEGEMDMRMPPHGPETGEFTCPCSPLQRAGKHPGKSDPFETFPKPARVPLAALGQRQIGKTRILPRQTPSRVTMSCEYK